MPAITPSEPLSPSYDIADSKAFVVNSLIDISPDDHRTFTIVYPNPAPAGLQVRLLRLTSPGGTPIDLVALAGKTDTTDRDSFPGLEVQATRIAPDALTQLTCDIISSDNGAFDEHYEVRVSADTAVSWTYRVQDGAPTSTSQVVRVVCDPIAGIGTPLANLLEKEPLTLNANDAKVTNGKHTVVIVERPSDVPGLAVPAPMYRFGHAGPIFIEGLPSAESGDQRYELVDASGNASLLPGVYHATTVPFTVDVRYANIGGSGTFLTGHGTSTGTIVVRPERVQLILDRSGSMNLEHRWDLAKTAARIFINFFGEFRAGVNDRDRIGVTVFSDPGDDGGWRPTGPAGPPNITDVIPLGDPATVSSRDLGADVFGDVGGSTPLGDGLFFGLRKLQELGPEPNAKHTVVLCTDGDETTGSIKVGPGAVPGNPRFWADAKKDPAIATILDDHTNLYTIGLGTAPNEVVLSNLTDEPKRFAAALSVGQLIDAFTTMFKESQEANKLDRRFTRIQNEPPPDGPLTEVFFDTTRATKFGVAVLKAPDPTPAGVLETVEIAHWDGGEFKTEATIHPKEYEGHFFINVSDASFFNDGSATWRIRRLRNDVPQTLTLADVIAFEDLHVKSVLSLDKRTYLTGEKMHLAVEIRNDGTPVLGATVRATLDAPVEGLGTLIAGLDADDLEQETINEGTEDRPEGRAKLVQAVLRKHGWHRFPRHNPDPGGLFIDGSNLLHDADGNGIYTNTFAKVHAEGVYNWTLTASGVVGAQNPFSHQLDQSVLAAVGISRRATTVRKETVKTGSPATSAVKVTITPQDDFDELLGPGHDESVVWVLSDGGAFEHLQKGQPAPVNTDGTYTRTVIFKRGTRPVLRVSVNGVVLPKIELAH
jgi:hypothetical protein